MQERLPTASPPEVLPTAVGARPATVQASADTPSHLADPRALQILTTEHWSLLSQRSLAWTETFSRAGMYLATLSAATVALALVGSVMRDGFVMFALVILPVVLFIGLATGVRLRQSAADDGRAVQGMNRIRHAYIEMVPDLEPYFLTSHYDDLPGVMVSLGATPDIARRVGEAGGGARTTPSSVVGNILHSFVTTAGMIMVINGVVGAAFVALVAIALGAASAVAVGIGVLGFVVVVGAQLVWGIRDFRKVSATLAPRFPTPPG
jgi:hypothetical protein